MADALCASDEGFFMGDLLDVIQRWLGEALDLSKFNGDFDQAMQACIAQEPLMWIKLQQGLSSLRQQMSVSHECFIAYQALLKHYPEQDLKASAIVITESASLDNMEAEMLYRFVLCQVLVWCEDIEQHRKLDQSRLFGEAQLPSLSLGKLSAELASIAQMSETHCFPQLSLLLLSEVLSHASAAGSLELLSRGFVEDQFKHFMFLCAENDFPVNHGNVAMMQGLQRHVSNHKLHYFSWRALFAKAQDNDIDILSRLHDLGFDFLLPLNGDMQGFIPYFGVQFMIAKGEMDAKILEQVDGWTQIAEQAQQSSRWDFLKTDFKFILEEWIDGSVSYILHCMEKAPEKTLSLYPDLYAELLSVVIVQAMDIAVGGCICDTPHDVLLKELNIKCVQVLALFQYLGNCSNAHMLKPITKDAVFNLIDPCCKNITSIDHWEKTVEAWLPVNEAAPETIAVYKALIEVCIKAADLEPAHDEKLAMGR